MIVYWIAAAEALLYLSAVPLELAFQLRAGRALRFGVGVAAFDARTAAARARSRMAEGRRRSAHPPHLPAKAWLAVLRRLRPERLSLDGAISLGDAAATALAYGGIDALAAALRGTSARVSVRVRPDFGSPEIDIRLRGMARIRAGHIISAAAFGGIQQIRGRIALWKSVPSKAS